MGMGMKKNVTIQERQVMLFLDLLEYSILVLSTWGTY